MKNFLIIDENLNIIHILKNKLLKSFYMIDFRFFSHYFDISIIQIKNFINLTWKSYLKKILLQFGINIKKLAI